MFSNQPELTAAWTGDRTKSHAAVNLETVVFVCDICIHRKHPTSCCSWWYVLFFFKHLGEATPSPQLSYFIIMYSYYVSSHYTILCADVSMDVLGSSRVSNQLVRCTVTLPPLGIIFQISSASFLFTLPWLVLSSLLLTEDVDGWAGTYSDLSKRWSVRWPK